MDTLHLSHTPTYPRQTLSLRLQVDWRISLGRFQLPTNWTVEVTKMSGIYPHFTKVRTLQGG